MPLFHRPRRDININIHETTNIYYCSCGRRPTLALLVNYDKTNFIMTDISLTIGVPAKPGIFTLLDKNNNPIPGVSFSNQQIGTVSDPSLASFQFDANMQVVPTGTAAGSGTVTFTTHASYLDPEDNTQKEGDFSVTKNFTVIPATSGSSVTFDVIF